MRSRVVCMVTFFVLILLFSLLVINNCYAYEFQSENDFIDGISLNFGTTVIYQYALNANGDILNKIGGDEDDWSYSVDLEMVKPIQDFGKVLIYFEAGGRQGVSDEIKAYSGVNSDVRSHEKPRLSEAWYEHSFRGLPLTITAGRMDATRFIDTNKYANDETAQFLCNMFVNSPVIEMPGYEAGVRLRVEPIDSIDLEFVAVNADSHWEDMYDTTFYAGQINIKPQLCDREGNYRLIGWFNDRDHTKWNDMTQKTETGYGFGVSFDQEATDNIGIFFRYGWQDPEVYINGDSFSLEHSASAGVQLNGSIWDRENDTAGLAYGLIWPSDDYKYSSSAAAKSEGHLEAYYRFWVNEHISIAPDIQIIWRPYGRDAVNGTDAITVFGVRGQINY